MAASVESQQPSIAATAATLNGDTKAPTLPRISPDEFRQYNRMADMMEYYVSSPLNHSNLNRSLTRHNHSTQTSAAPGTNFTAPSRNRLPPK